MGLKMRDVLGLIFLVGGSFILDPFSAASTCLIQGKRADGEREDIEHRGVACGGGRKGYISPATGWLTRVTTIENHVEGRT